MGGIFISYRRDDSRAFAEQIKRALDEHFADTPIFFDIDDIGGGDDWSDTLDDFLADPGVLVAVIGRGWASATDDEGNLRLHEPGDWVRREVATAIQKAVVLPVLVNGASLPGADELPPDLRRLSSFQAMTIDRAKRFEDEVDTLVRAVRHALTRSQAVAAKGARTNIVRDLTVVIGREDEVEDLRGELNRARLVTVTGPGGVGKSRLVRETALELVHRYDEGGWLVAVADVDDPGLLDSEVAEVLGVPEPSDRPLRSALVDHLAEAEALLILDGCDRVVDAAAKLAHTLLSDSARLRIVATCREALGVPGEAVWALAPLQLPAAGAGPDDIRSAEAVQLFETRARLVDRTFRLDDNQLEAVAEVCRLTDGLPLAIELAAANMGATTVAQLAERLRSGLQMLVTRSRLVEDRQRTLQATIGWSYDLLEPDERAVLDRLAVFRSGFTVEAAEAVAGGGEVAAASVAPTLFRLVEKSLVTVPAESSPDVRYRLYRTVRQFAADRLADAGDLADVDRLHAEYYVRWAERGATQVIGEAHSEWMQRFYDEDDNLRAALDFALASGAIELATRLGAALIWFWYWSSRFIEARETLRRVNALPNAPDSAARSLALFGEGMFASTSGDLDESERAFEQSTTVAAALDDTAAVGRGLMGQGLVSLYRGDLATAAARLGESEAKLRSLGSPPQLPLTLRFLGAVAVLRGEVDRAQEVLEEALELLRANPGSGGTSWSLDELADLAVRRREFDRAVEYLDESLAVSSRIGSVRQQPWTLLRKAQAARGDEREEDAAAELAEALRLFRMSGEERGLGWAMCEQAEQAKETDPAAAAAALDEAERHFDAIGDRRGRAEVARLRGDLALEARDFGNAGRLQRDALETFVAAQDMWGVSRALEGLGRVELAREHLETAARLMGAAQGLQESLRVASPDAIAGSQELMAVARRIGMEPRELRREWEKGVAETDEPSDLPLTAERLALLLGE